MAAIAPGLGGSQAESKPAGEAGACMAPCAGVIPTSRTVSAWMRLSKMFWCRNKGDEEEEPPGFQMGGLNMGLCASTPKLWWKKCGNWRKRSTNWETTKTWYQGYGDL